MKTKLLLLSVLLALATPSTQAQGTFVYDQQSSSDELFPYGGVPIQAYSSVGQSFTPSLSTVGFVRFKLYDIAPENSLGATLAVNLRANSMSGTILGTTTPVAMTNGFAGSMNFFFASAVAVVPNTTYFLQTVVQSGDNWGITTRSDSQGDVNYPGGSFYGSGFPFSASDLWFREGIVVPEPSSALLFFVGGGVAGWFMRRKQHPRRGFTT